MSCVSASMLANASISGLWLRIAGPAQPIMMAQSNSNAVHVAGMAVAWGRLLCAGCWSCIRVAIRLGMSLAVAMNVPRTFIRRRSFPQAFFAGKEWDSRRRRGAGQGGLAGF